MNALSSMNDYDALGELSKSTTPFSVFSRSVEETQSVSVSASGCLWQEVLAQMVGEDTSIILSSAAIAQEEVERIEDIQKREELRKLLKSWREEGDEEEQRETWECLKRALHEDGFC
jgi:hypothetical protein